MSLKEVAKRSGVSHPYLSQIENNKRNTPKPDMIRKLAKGLNVPYVELMQEAGYVDEKGRSPVDTLAELGGLDHLENYVDLYSLLTRGETVTFRDYLLTPNDKNFLLAFLDREFLDKGKMKGGD